MRASVGTAPQIFPFSRLREKVADLAPPKRSDLAPPKRIAGFAKARGRMRVSFKLILCTSSILIGDERCCFALTGESVASWTNTLIRASRTFSRKREKGNDGEGCHAPSALRNSYAIALPLAGRAVTASVVELRVPTRPLSAATLPASGEGGGFVRHFVSSVQIAV
jgi:hypothetical protein